MALDLSSLTASVPEDGTGRGVRMFNDVLEAIMARRERLQAQEQARADAKAQQDAQMQFNRDKLAQDERFKQADDERSEQIRQDQQAQAQANLKEKQREKLAGAMKDIPQMATSGAAGMIPGYLGAHGAKLNAKELPAPPPDFQQEMSPEASIPIAQEQMAREAAVNGVYEMDIDGQKADLDFRSLTPEARAAAIQALELDHPQLSAAKGRAAEYARLGMIKPGTESGPIEDAQKAIEAEKRARISATRRETLSAGEGARLKETQTGGWRQTYSDFEAQNKVPTFTEGYQRVQGLVKSAEDYKKTGNTVEQRRMIFDIAKQLSGPGVLTEGDIKNTVKNTKGFLETMRSKWETVKSGDLSEAEHQALATFVQNALVRARERAAGLVKTFDTQYGPGSGEHYAEVVPDQVAASRRGLMQRYELTDDDVARANSGKNAAESALEKALSRKRGAKK